jgi:adenylate cyclase
MAALKMGPLFWLYRRLGSFYPAAFVTLTLQSAFIVTVGAVALYTFYYDAERSDFLRILFIALGLTAFAMLIALLRIYRRLRPVQEWIGGRRDPNSTAEAWRTAVSFPYEMVRRDMWIPIALVCAPSAAASVAILDVSWLAFFPIFAGALVSLGYSGILHHFVVEAGFRPVLIDINQAVPPRLRQDAGSMPVRMKLLLTLPMINVITGVVVAAMTSDGGGGTNLGVDVLVALAVSFTISFELTVLLSKSILRPIEDLEQATEEIRRGNYSRHVPITTGDEIGDLGVGFNQMVEGLAERERIREAFGTYLDKEVAEYILSEGFSTEGTEVEVSILFCDVRDFTRFAAQADAQEVVANLNRLFETVVPMVAHHGGHVDKFVGDGLVAVFGAPEWFPDHADRAVRAACEMARVVNSGGDGAFRIGVGVNSGRVVAGSIGGGGRLNFSVIGDPVNVASRVEAATRQTGDDVLITATTRDLLGEEIEVETRGPVELKGYDMPVEVFAPKLPADVPARSYAESASAGAGLGRAAEATAASTHTLPGA